MAPFPPGSQQQRRRLVAALLAAVGIVLATPVMADVQDMPSASQVKAAFLFKFPAYVTWPPSAFEQAQAPLVIGVIGDDDVADELSRLVAGRSVDHHAIVMRRIGVADPVLGVHVLFIGGETSEQLARILDATRSHAILTVTEQDDALGAGSVINFMLIDDQVRFDVSLPAAERNKLKISARLLTVAHQVVTVTP